MAYSAGVPMNIGPILCGDLVNGGKSARKQCMPRLPIRIARIIDGLR
jgi:hypothetical protein